MVQRPRGTRDFTPKVMARRLAFEQLLEERARRHGFLVFKLRFLRSWICLLQSQDRVLYRSCMPLKTKANVNSPFAQN